MLWDLDCSSGDEVDEVKETDVLLTTKRKRAGKDAAFPSPPKPIAAETSDDRDDAEAAFLALMTAKDPILGKTRIEIETDALPSLSCGFPEAIASTSSSDTKPEDKPEITDGETTVVTEVFDFAGDEVKVQRVVSTEEAKEIEAREKRKENEKSKKPAQKRSGLGGALTLIAKKPKMSVLDKSNLDWSSYKAENNLQEELERFNRGKNGYLEKMEFLSRTDYKEFEKEKAVRNASRKPI